MECDGILYDFVLFRFFLCFIKLYLVFYRCEIDIIIIERHLLLLNDGRIPFLFLFFCLPCILSLTEPKKKHTTLNNCTLLKFHWFYYLNNKWCIVNRTVCEYGK